MRSQKQSFGKFGLLRTRKKKKNRGILTFVLFPTLPALFLDCRCNVWRRSSHLGLVRMKSTLQAWVSGEKKGGWAPAAWRSHRLDSRCTGVAEGREPCFAQLPLSFPRLQPDMVISWSHHHGSCHRLTISGTQGSARILGEHLSRAPRRKLIPGNRTDCQGPLKKGKKETEFNYPNHR